MGNSHPASLTQDSAQARERPDQSSSLTSTQGLILRVVVAGVLVVALVVGIVWYVGK